jgi:hypothetical protein
VAWIDSRAVAATAAALLGDLGPVPGEQHDYPLTDADELPAGGGDHHHPDRTGVRVVPVTADEQAADLRATGMPAEFAAILATADAGVRAGREDEVGTAVLELTGRPPRTFAEFVDDHAARWATPAG